MLGSPSGPRHLGVALEGSQQVNFYNPLTIYECDIKHRALPSCTNLTRNAILHRFRRPERRLPAAAKRVGARGRSALRGSAAEPQNFGKISKRPASSPEPQGRRRGGSRCGCRESECPRCGRWRARALSLLAAPEEQYLRRPLLVRCRAPSLAHADPFRRLPPAARCPSPGATPPSASLLNALHPLPAHSLNLPLFPLLPSSPGNAGISREPGVKVPPLAITDHQAVIQFCTEHRVGLVVIGPEAPLVDGAPLRGNPQLQPSQHHHPPPVLSNPAVEPPSLNLRAAVAPPPPIRRPRGLPKRRWVPHLRPEQARSAARGLKGLHEGPVRAPQRPDGRL